MFSDIFVRSDYSFTCGSFRMQCESDGPPWPSASGAADSDEKCSRRAVRYAAEGRDAHRTTRSSTGQVDFSFQLLVILTSFFL